MSKEKFKALPPVAALWDKGSEVLIGGSADGNITTFSTTFEEVCTNIAELTADRKLVVFDLKELAKKFPAEALDTTRLFDVKLASYLENCTTKSDTLEDCAAAILGWSAEDGVQPDPVKLLLDLYSALSPRWQEAELFKGIEMPLSLVLSGMEKRGITLDDKELKKFGTQIRSQLETLEKSIYDLAGTTFNINSPKQLSTLLFETLELPPPGKKTKSGYSTDAEALKKVQDLHPIIPAVLEFRTLSKLESTYIEGLAKAQQADGKLHTSFNMTATATGRLSSSEPNLQNIPVSRSEKGSELRKFLIADPGEILIDADYSQIELRLLAHIANDEVMLEAFRNDLDIHTVTASQVFEVPFEEVTPELRRRAKAVNFGIVYGISAFALAADLQIERGEAQGYIDNYFAKYSGVKKYLDSVVKNARKAGYVETVLGRRRALPELKSPVFAVRSFGERVALNMPIQGTAADLIKIAMINVDRELKKAGLKAGLLLQIHDELLLSAPESEAEAAAAILRREMENAMKLNVPLKVSLSTGRSYFEVK